MRLRPLLAPVLAAVVVGLPASAAVAAPAPLDGASWRLEQPAGPGGTPVPLGSVGDLAFTKANRALLTTQGTAAVPPGLFTFDGTGWRRLSTVCGGAASASRIAVAGPAEAWVIADTAERGRPGVPGRSLCRLRDGAIVASYAVRDDSEDPYGTMQAAICRGPSDCWFGGGFAEAPGGGRRGAFHLRWDGSSLSTVYGPQGRAIADFADAGGDLLEATYVGARPDGAGAPPLRDPEPAPLLLHHLSGAGIFADPFTPAARDGVATAGTELLAMDSAGPITWAVGGGAASGPDAGDGVLVERPPIAVVVRDGFVRELPLPDDAFGPTERFVDVAAVPGTDLAWVAVEDHRRKSDPEGDAKVALLSADGAVLQVDVLPGTTAPRGVAARLDCSGPRQCWMATAAGWLYHWTDGAPVARDDDPAWSASITQRPRDGRSPQPVPDAPPVDDSALFAPAPVEAGTAAEVAGPVTDDAAAAAPRAAALRSIGKARLVGRTKLRLRFRVTRRVRVGLVGRRGGKVVARAKVRTLAPGMRTLTMTVSKRRSRFPTKLEFVLRELDGSATPTAPTTPAPEDEEPTTEPPFDADAQNGPTEEIG